MKPDLSKREKFLLFSMIIIVIIFVSIKFFIIPKYNQYQELSEEYEVLTYEKAELELKLQSEPLVHAGYEKAEKAFGEIIEAYPAFMPSQEVDRFLTGLCLQNKLNPLSLGISKPIGIEFMQDENQDLITKEVPLESAVFLIVKANMNLSGAYESLQGLINTVKDLNYIRMNQVSFSLDRNNMSTTGGSSSISVNFEITMLNDIYTVKK